jgi:hypothetical protein
VLITKAIKKCEQVFFWPFWAEGVTSGLRTCTLEQALLADQHGTTQKPFQRPGVYMGHVKKVKGAPTREMGGGGAMWHLTVWAAMGHGHWTAVE